MDKTIALNTLADIGFILLGALIYVLLGIAKFKKAKKHNWSLNQWLRLNGVETLLGLVCSITIYALGWIPSHPVSLLALGMCLDTAVKMLTAKTGNTPPANP